MVTVDANAVFFAVKKSQNHQLQDLFYTHRKCVRKAGINIKSRSCQRFLKTNYLDTFLPELLQCCCFGVRSVPGVCSGCIQICFDSHLCGQSLVSSSWHCHLSVETTITCCNTTNSGPFLLRQVIFITGGSCHK